MGGSGGRSAEAQTNLVITRTKPTSGTLNLPGRLGSGNHGDPLEALTDAVFFSISSLITLILYFC